jgi:hypothetical protein
VPVFVFVVYGEGVGARDFRYGLLAHVRLVPSFLLRDTVTVEKWVNQRASRFA